MGTFEHMKKIDLHCHLDGSLSYETLCTLAENIGQKLPPKDELQPKLQVGPECTDLGAYLACFDVPLPFLCTAQNFKDAVKGVLRDAAREHVVYMEIRFSPLQSDGYGISHREMIEAAIEGLREGERAYGIAGNLILCGMRHMDVSENLRMLRNARDYYGEGVCALDMAGNEAAYPILGQREFFEEARRLGIPFTIHAGECGSTDSIRDALGLGASRIGHGIAAIKSPALMQELRDRKIPLELCPTSNLQTRAVASKAEYPFLSFCREGLMVTVNTDNRTVSGTDLSREFAWLEREYGLDFPGAQELTKASLEAAFAPDDTKQKVWRVLS